MGNRTEKFSNIPPTIPPTIPSLDPASVQLFESAGLTVKQLEPLGVEIYGIDVRFRLPEPVIAALEVEMAHRGFIVFKHQAGLSADELVEVSKWWGAGEILSTHGVHPATPGMNRDIFRCSNDNHHGILGVGPQWHNDGSFEAATFSHSAYYMARAPEQGGGTHFAHQGAAFDVLPKETREFWERLVSVHSTTGVTHPVVHTHPLSRRKSVWLHLGAGPQGGTGSPSAGATAGIEDHGSGDGQIKAESGALLRITSAHQYFQAPSAKPGRRLAGRWCRIPLER